MGRASENAAVLESPAVTMALSRLVGELMSLHDEHSSLEQQVTELKAELKRLVAESTEVKGRLATVEAKLADIELGVSELFTDIISNVLQVERCPLGITTLAELADSVKGDAEKEARYRAKLEELALTDDIIASIRRVMQLGNGVAHFDIWETSNHVATLRSKVADAFPGGRAIAVASTRGPRRFMVEQADANELVRAFGTWVATLPATA